jgi:LL-diaminopimelate aminotransferase
MHKAQRLSLIPPYLFGEIARLKAQAIAEGRDLVDLGIGDPDQPTPKAIIAKLGEYAEDPSTHRYDESNAGREEFLQAGARWFKTRFGADIDPQTEMVEVIGSKEALAHIIWATIDAGDVALVPDPAYTVCKVNTLLAGGQPYEFSLTAENHFLPELDKIPADVVRKAKVIYLNYPNNPTGAVATREFFEYAVAWARETDTLIIHDCAYSEVCFDGYKAPSILEVPGAKDVAIEMHSLSKTFNMTGWRIGFAAGNPDAVKALNTIKSNVDSKQFAAIALTAGWALENINNDESLTLIKRRRDVLVDGLNRLGWNIEKPKATFYVWVPAPQGHNSVSFAKLLLEDAGVLRKAGRGGEPDCEVEGDGLAAPPSPASGGA